MQSVSIVELPHGGWRLRVSEADGSYRLIGRYATASDAARTARLNGFQPEFEASDELAQLEFTFEQGKLALSA
ncbi:MAG: hypothetical protein ACFB21_15420 [Opitutales bacterium]